jgi:hypothetical protein
LAAQTTHRSAFLTLAQRSTMSRRHRHGITTSLTAPTLPKITPIRICRNVALQPPPLPRSHHVSVARTPLQDTMPSRPRHENLAQRTAAPIRIVDFKSSAASPHVLARSRFLRPCASHRARFANTLRPHFHHLKPCMSSAGSQTHIASGNPTPVFRFVSARPAPRVASSASPAPPRGSLISILFSLTEPVTITPPLPLVHLHDGALAVAIFAYLAVGHARRTAPVIQHHSHDVIHEPTTINRQIARQPPRSATLSMFS